MRRASLLVVLGLSACGVEEASLLLQPPPLPLSGDGGFVDTGVTLPDAGVLPRLDGGMMPPPDAGVNLRAHGAACSSSRQCEGGTCLRADGFTGGYCTLSGCSFDETCGSPFAYCVDEFGMDFCAVGCTQGQGCRAGYVCRTASTVGPLVCLPPEPVMPRNDGEECVSDTDCLGGACLEHPEWPMGHCTTLNCGDDFSCSGPMGTVGCVAAELPEKNAVSFCLQRCTNITECRSEYACSILVPPTEGLCIPDRVEGPLPNTMGLPGTLLCEASSGGMLRFEYTVPAGISSYMVTPMTRDARLLRPLAIDLPNGTSIDLLGDNAFQAVSSGFLGYMNPTVVPGTDAHVSQRRTGQHVYRLESRSADACLLLQTETSAGDQIDLRFYFTGTSILNAASAPNDPNMQVMLTTLSEVFDQAGISIGVIRFRDVPEPNASRYRFLTSVEDFQDLMALSEPLPSNPLIMNVFFVESIGPELGAWGISPAEPGPAGLHHARGTSVVATAELFGVELMGPDGLPIDGNVQTGLIVGHEIGHFLGLWHTTEQNGTGNTDPLNDTPICPANTPDVTSCPDWGNLMFPFADGGNRNLTPGQAFVIGAHPLTKE